MAAHVRRRDPGPRRPERVRGVARAARDVPPGTSWRFASTARRPTSYKFSAAVRAKMAAAHKAAWTPRNPDLAAPTPAQYRVYNMLRHRAAPARKPSKRPAASGGGALLRWRNDSGPADHPGRSGGALRISPRTLLAEIAAGRLRYVRVGKRRRFKPADIDTYIERQRRGCDGSGALSGAGWGRRTTTAISRSTVVDFETALARTTKKPPRS